MARERRTNGARRAKAARKSSESRAEVIRKPRGSRPKAAQRNTREIGALANVHASECRASGAKAGARDKPMHSAKTDVRDVNFLLMISKKIPILRHSDSSSYTLDCILSNFQKGWHGTPMGWPSTLDKNM